MGHHNTFLSPSTIKRPYISKKSKGIETSEYDGENSMIVHSLYPKEKNYFVRHSFFYYIVEKIKELFEGLKFEEKNTGNSIYIKISC